MSSLGESHLVGLIGSGITRSLTPPMHEREADELGLRYLYRPIDLDILGRPASDVGALLKEGRDLGFTAFNITFPCKQMVLEHLDELSADARSLGSVNTVLIRDGRFIGHNTDHSGFAWGLTNGLAGASLNRVVQLGAGGAGTAVAYALLTAGARTLHISDLDADRVSAFVATLGAIFPDRDIVAIGPSDLPGVMPLADGLVNATPVGMHHHPGLPLDESLVRSHLWVADVVYRPLETELLRLATDRGCRVLDGGNMAVGQAIDTFELITGVSPDPARIRAHFLDLIAREV
ncbi:shikimate dehydrogenase [Homoserinimonas sp. A447]